MVTMDYEEGKLNPMTVILITPHEDAERWDTQGRRPCEDWGSDWRNVVISQETPTFASSRQKMATGEAWQVFASEPPEGLNPNSTLI